jgi:hypothetical protein
MSENNPVHSIAYGPVRVSIWRNVASQGLFYDVVPSRSYKSQEGWANTTTFREADLPTLAKALLDAQSWIQTQRQHEPQASASDASQ